MSRLEAKKGGGEHFLILFYMLKYFGVEISSESRIGWLKSDLDDEED